MHIYLRGSIAQKTRLLSGIVLFAFAAAHFLNHALGLVSLEAMHEMQAWRTVITRSPSGTTVLLIALITHIVAALYRIAMRSSWAMPRWEAIQIATGIAIPFLLFPHIINTRIASVYFGVEDSYLYELVRLWPENAVLQSTLLLLVWTHGCLGLHYWLRLSDAYWRAVPVLLVAAIAVPVLALAGFAVAGQRTSDIMADPQALSALKIRSNWPEDDDGSVLAWLRTGSRVIFFALVAAALFVAVARRFLRVVVSKNLRIAYVDGPTIAFTPGQTLLEISRAAGIGHASVCGGRGRCSTCRVKIEDGLKGLPRPHGPELATLRSIKAPPNVRLACQVTPSTNLTVTLISHPTTPKPPQEHFVDLEQFVSAHIRAEIANHLTDVRSKQAEVVCDWLTARLPHAVSLSEVHEFNLIGARIEYLLKQPTAAIVYQRHDRNITLFVAPIAATAAFAMRGQLNGYHVLAWSDARSAYAAVSDLPPSELDLLEQSLRIGEPVLRDRASAATG